LQPVPASICAFLASFGTFLAMFVFVLGTFVVASLANFNAFAHYVRGVRRITRDKTRR
jgi:mannose/fructose/N-acetylgalactosamine-specific phosphotransferase system component IID